MTELFICANKDKCKEKDCSHAESHKKAAWCDSTCNFYENDDNQCCVPAKGGKRKN